MTYHESDADTAAAERRSNTRSLSGVQARITVQANEMDARIDNESVNGLFVVLEAALEVDVTWNDGEGQRQSRARLLRVSSLPGQQTGWGLELFSEKEGA